MGFQYRESSVPELRSRLSLAKTPRCLNVIHVACDATSSYVIDFKCSPELGEVCSGSFRIPRSQGAPTAEVLKSIASHEMPLSEAEKWLDHLTSCNPATETFVTSRRPIEPNTPPGSRPTPSIHDRRRDPTPDGSTATCPQLPLLQP